MSVISESEFNEAWYLGLTTGEQLPVFSRHKDEQHTHVEGAAFTLSKSAQRPLWNGIQCHQGLSRSDPRTCLLLRRFDFSRKTGEAGGLISTRNWGGTREGSREGERHPFPFPSSLARSPLWQRERRLGTRQSKDKYSTCYTQHYSRWQNAHLGVWSYTAPRKCMIPYAKSRYVI